MFGWFRKKTEVKCECSCACREDDGLQKASDGMRGGLRHFTVKLADGKRYLIRRIGFDV